MVRRATLLFFASAAMQASSIAYVNVNAAAAPDTAHYVHIAFGSSAGLLGLLILACYAVKPEAPSPAADAKATALGRKVDPGDVDGSLTCECSR